MSKEGYWVIRTYIAGMVGEKIKYWIEGEKPTKSTRRIKSDIKKRQQNEASAVKRVARDINANFNTQDYLVGLDYSDEAFLCLLDRIEKSGVNWNHLDNEGVMNAIRDEAIKDGENFIRRVKRSLPKGAKVKYLVFTSDMDGKKNEIVRIHHHIIISGNAIEACKLKWKDGSVDYEHIWDEPDHTGLAEYLLKQVRHVPDAKKYKPSKTLIHPEPKDKVAINQSELRVPKHCALLYRGEFKPGMPQYIRYMLPPKPLADREKAKSENEDINNGSGTCEIRDGGERYER